MMFTMDDVAHLLAGYEPELLPEDKSTPAAVALLLGSGPAGLSILFIERAAHEKDPWSGNLCFPGGKVEQGDGSSRAAAERETFEEVGIDLRKARYLGRLSDIAGAHLPVRVSCFVYGVDSTLPLQLSEEVGDAFWIPLEELFDAERHGESPVWFAGQELTRPAVRLSLPGKPVLWGITYRLVMQLLELLEGHESGA